MATGLSGPGMHSPSLSPPLRFGDSGPRGEKSLLFILLIYCFYYSILIIFLKEKATLLGHIGNFE